MSIEGEFDVEIPDEPSSGIFRMDEGEVLCRLVNMSLFSWKQ